MKKYVFLLALLVSSPVFAAQQVGSSTSGAVSYIEQIHFDGTMLNVVYGVQARCKSPSDHQTGVVLQTLRSPIRTFQLVITNKETRYCNESPTFLRLAESLNLRTLIDQKRGSNQANYTLILPRVTFTNRAPIAWNPAGVEPSVAGNTTTTGQVPVPTNQANYAFSCVLYKKDGARRDGFTGIDPDITIARQKASRSCNTTNNPNCDYWSKHPDHTTCGVVDADTGSSVQAKVEWTCELWKRDGAKKDGFSGWGNTELEARAQSAKGCQRTNNPRCNEWSKNPDHTACTAKIVQQ